jgi:hypothetical protein
MVHCLKNRFDLELKLIQEIYSEILFLTEVGFYSH